jgi:hypothetical protein
VNTHAARSVVAAVALVAAASCELPLDGVALDATPEPPRPPDVAPPSTPTSSSTATLRGTRPANTALFLDGEEVAPREGPTAFRLRVALAPGFNTFILHAVDAAGRSSEEITVTIARDDVAPSPIGFTTAPPARTARTRLDLTATKDTACVVWQDGDLRADVAVDDVFFSVDDDLALGRNRFRFTCVDDADNEAALTQLDVERVEIEALPFSLQEPPASIVAASLVLSATCDDDVEAQAGALAPTPCAGGAWSAEVPLIEGDNEITVRAAFTGELGNVAQTSTHHVLATLPAGEGEGEGE